VDRNQNTQIPCILLLCESSKFSPSLATTLHEHIWNTVLPHFVDTKDSKASNTAAAVDNAIYESTTKVCTYLLYIQSIALLLHKCFWKLRSYYNTLINPKKKQSTSEQVLISTISYALVSTLVNGLLCISQY